MRDDSISRKAALNALQKEIDKAIPPFNDVIGSIRCGVRLARNIIEDLPSVPTERKTGKWLQISPAGIYECSECGQTVMTKDISCYKFCHGCGAYMGGEQDGSD